MTTNDAERRNEWLARRLATLPDAQRDVLARVAALMDELAGA